MRERVLHILEYDKIIERLAAKTASAPGRRLAEQLQPSPCLLYTSRCV